MAYNFLLNNTESDTNLYLASFVHAFQHQLIDWIDKNRALYQDLIAISESFSFNEEGENFYIVGINEITEEELAYLDVKEPTERHSRLKALAAIEMIAHYERITHSFKHQGPIAAKFVMVYTFLYFRSFAQFTSSRAVEDGIKIQAGRRTKSPKKQPLLELKRKFQKQFPTADSRQLWREIRANYFKLLRRKIEKSAHHTPLGMQLTDFS